MTKIYYVQDLDFFEAPGGAEQTDRVYFKEGLKRGHDLNLITPHSPLGVEKDDLVILSNIRAYERSKILGIPCRTVTFTHDTWCAYRLYLPLTEKCFTDCPEYPFWNEVYKKAELNIFLSPLHYDIHKERFGESVEPHFLTPSGFDDVDRFVDMKNGRSGVCNLNGLLGFKGREQLFKYAGEHPEVAMDIGGSNMEGDKRLDVDLPPNIRYVGPIQSSELPKFYNKYEFYVELHDRPQPYNRTIVESYLSGCKLIVNSLVGATSWPWFTDRDSVRAHLKSAPSEFWVKLEKELNL